MTQNQTTLWGHAIHGLSIDSNTRCAHYHNALDIIAIRFKCCGVYYPCCECHKALADHPIQRWPATEFDQKAILCGACGHELTITEYMESSSRCPACEMPFNPGCMRHWSYYFEAEGDVDILTP